MLGWSSAEGAAGGGVSIFEQKMLPLVHSGAIFTIR